MVKKGRRTKTELERYTSLGIEVQGFEATSSVRFNQNLKMDRPFFYSEDDLAYEFVTELEITGVCTYPAKRASDTYKITILGQEPHAGRFSRTLKDFHVKDEYGVPEYRKYRGEEYPIFEGPPGVAVLEKRRGEPIWNAWIWVASRLVSDMFVQLTNIQPLFLSIDEDKIGRKRWVRSFSLQSSDPANE